MPWDGTWVSLLWVLLSIVVIIGLSYWFTKHVVGRGGLGGLGMTKGTEGIKVLARQALGRDQGLMLVRAGERYFLLGVTPAGISNLAEFTPEEAKAWTALEQQPAGNQLPSFGEALCKVIKEKRQR